MRIDIMTLFPDTVNAVLHESIIGRAAKKGIIEINCIQIRDFTDNKQNQVDDYPYGGGWGCILMAQPLKACLDNIMSTANGLRSHVIYLTPQGKPYSQETAKRLKNDYDHIVLVCGHYEGIDERFIEKCVDEEISLGDFVLTGGEIAAMAVADSVCRLVPGVLSDEQCYTGESHWDGLLEYPQYTRPEEWEGLSVPNVLLEGNHSKIEKWRHIQQLRRTAKKRPDMFEKLTLSEDDKKMIAKPEIEKNECRMAKNEDLGSISEIVAYAKKTLASHNVDQWQGPYPTVDDYAKDIENGMCRVITVNGDIAAVFSIGFEHESDYDAITDGKWSSDDPYGTVHRAAVAEKYRGSGLSAYIFSYAEQICRENGIKFLRVDTHKKNKSMQRLLNSCGFKYRGNILVYSEPGHDPERQAYDKVVKKC